MRFLSKFCTSCGKEIAEGSNVCSNCGTPVDGAPVAPAANTVTVTQTAAPTQGNGMAVAGFVLSLISLLCCGFLSVLGLIFSILGLSKSSKVGGKGKGLSIAGIIMSSIAIILIILYLLFMPAFTNTINDMINEEWDNINDTINDEWDNYDDYDYSTGY